MAIQIDDETINHASAVLLAALVVASMLGSMLAQFVIFLIDIAAERKARRDLLKRPTPQVTKEDA